MKNTLKALAAGIALISFVSCDNDATTETMTDSTDVNTTMSEEYSTTVTTVTPGKYVNLSTGTEVEIDKDASTGYWVDVSTRTPVEYYIHPGTRDTFDMMGRNVNYALDRMEDGKYMVNEERLKIKMDSDGDMKMKSEDGSKMKYDASSGQLKTKDGDTKEKISPDEYKSKTDSTKVKVKQ